jgi:3-phosphoglycerate kinase
MEMLAIYFALAENQRQISMIANRQGKKQLVVNIRSDSKTSIEQLQGISEVRDAVLQRICAAIKKLLEKMAHMIIFSHLERTRNHAGLLLEQRRRKEIEKYLMHQYQKQYYSASGFMIGQYGLTTA